MARRKKVNLNDSKRFMAGNEADVLMPVIQNSLADLNMVMMENGLESALSLDAYPTGFPNNQGNPLTPMISRATPLFKNLRWYFLSNFQQLINQIYVEIGLVKTIVDVPVDDALRNGIDIKSQELDPDDIAKLQTVIDREDDLGVIAEAAKWNRLFGGAGVVIFSDQDPETPFDISKLNEKSRLEFRAADIWELFYDKQNIEGFNPTVVLGDETSSAYSYYGVKVDESRVLRLTGLTAPSFVRPRLRGWGLSVVEQLVRSINQYLKATDLSYEVLDEFKLDIFKMKNLINTLLSPNGEQQVRRRVALANYNKNYQNALVMDSEDDFDHKQLSFSGLAETMSEIRKQVAADMRMPISKLFGTSEHGGLNSGSSESDLEVYNAMVESEVRNKIKYHILRILEIRCQILFGFVPEDLKVSFKPLRILSAEQDENVKTQKFTRAYQALQAGVMTAEEFRDNANKAGLFDIELQQNDLFDDEVNPGGFNNDTIGEEDGEEGETPGADADDSEDPVTNSGRPDFTCLVPKVWTVKERIDRVLKNSALFDKASYVADGGDGWIDDRRKYFFDDLKTKDPVLYKKAVDASVKALGQESWKFIAWFFRKYGRVH